MPAECNKNALYTVASANSNRLLGLVQVVCFIEALAKVFISLVWKEVLSPALKKSLSCTFLSADSNCRTSGTGEMDGKNTTFANRKAACGGKALVEEIF